MRRKSLGLQPLEWVAFGFDLGVSVVALIAALQGRIGAAIYLAIVAFFGLALVFARVWGRRAAKSSTANARRQSRPMLNHAHPQSADSSSSSSAVLAPGSLSRRPKPQSRLIYQWNRPLKLVRKC